MQGLRVGGTRIFWRLLASSCAGVLVASGLIYTLVARGHERALLATLESSLRGATFLVERAADPQSLHL